MMRRLRDIAILFAAAGFFWYGVWAFCYHALHLDAVQSWLAVIGLLIGIAWFVARQKKAADALPYVVVEEPVPPVEWGQE